VTDFDTAVAAEAAEAPLSRDSLGAQVARWLRDRIVTGEVAPGERVNEVALAAQLAVSRGPIREALQQLASEGLVELRPKRGAYVRTFDRDQLVNLYAVRIVLEVLAARLAATRRTEAQLAALRNSIAKAIEGVAADAHYPFELDMHRLVVDASGNPELARFLSLVNQQIRLGRARSGWQPQRAPSAFNEHVAIVDAVAAADPDAAAEAMQTHLENSLDSVSTLFGLNSE
jgi:DNA-binding GntR family transcriptional regulator